MTSDVFDILIILCLHFISDFVLQSRKMGQKKSKSLFWLSLHVLVYTTFLFWGWVCFVGFKEYSVYTVFGVYFMVWISHFLTDFITSQFTTYAYVKSIEKGISITKRDRWQYIFWAILGFDQFIHHLSLILIYNYIN